MQVHPTFSHDSFNPKRNRSRLIKRIGLIAVFVSVSSLSGYALAMGYLLFKTQEIISVVSTAPVKAPSVLGVAKSLLPSNEDAPPLKGESSGRVNVLLLGKAAEGYPGQNLTDTIIITSLNTETKRVALLSLPRDLYIPLEKTEGGSGTKINALYAMGKDEDDPFATIRSVVSSITGLDIHYSLVVDYQAFIQTIDALGGINVLVERDIYDTRFPGPNYSYETFSLEKGMHHLDGETALKYVRERHSDPRGDFGRAERQQHAIQAVKNKVFSTKTFLNPMAIGGLLSTLEDNVRTDIAFEEIERFIQISKELDLHNMETLVVDAWRPESLLRVSHIYLDNGQRMFALAPRTGTFEELQMQAEHIFEQSYLEKRHENIQKESASAILISYGNARIAEKIQGLLTDIGFEEVRVYYEDATREAPEHSYVFDTTTLSKPYSLDEIIRFIPARKTTNNSDIPEDIKDASVDFFVVLGEDASERHAWKEASIEEWQESIQQE